MISKEKIFKNIYKERLDRIEKLTKKTDYYDLNLLLKVVVIKLILLT